MKYNVKYAENIEVDPTFFKSFNENINIIDKSYNNIFPMSGIMDTTYNIDYSYNNNVGKVCNCKLCRGLKDNQKPIRTIKKIL